MTNRKIRDTVFCHYMSAEQHLLELGNALKGTQYTDPSSITINTLDGSFYSNIKNDISFLMENLMVVLIEHQTTINPNMPLRFLSYVDELFRRYTQPQQKKIYSSELIKLPTPNFYVFYDGDDDSFDRYTLRLSDAFEIPSNNLELTVSVYNLATGKSKELKNLCQPLNEYSIFSNKYKDFRKQNLTIDESVREATHYCLENNIMYDYLKNNESEVISMFGFEWNEKEEREALLEAGEARGEARSEARGRLLALKDLVLDGTVSLKTASQKAGMSIDSFKKAVML